MTDDHAAHQPRTDPEPCLGIDGATHILGLIADPVVQARTPRMVSDLLLRRGRFGQFVLVPMEVGAADIATFVVGLRSLRNFAGAVVSMPHKTVMADLVDELTPAAAQVGAVNVIRRDADGRLHGTLLDGEGFVAGLAAAGHDVTGRRVLLCGAGGAASAVAFALARHGCAALYLQNRTREKAERLAARVREQFPDVSVSTTEPDGPVDLAVNGTSLGMQPEDALPIPRHLVLRSALVAECVIAPEMTRLLELASSCGKQIHTGVPMLRAQLEAMLAFMGVD